eukprot:78326_1
MGNIAFHTSAVSSGALMAVSLYHKIPIHVAIAASTVQVMNGAYVKGVASALAENIRNCGESTRDMVEIAKKNGNMSLVFADYKDYDREYLQFYKLFTYLDAIPQSVSERIRQKFTNARQYWRMAMRSKITFEELMKEEQYDGKLNKRYFSHNWWFMRKRSLIIWKSLMGVSKPGFVDHKRIVGFFGMAHVIDVKKWHNAKRLDDFKLYSKL